MGALELKLLVSPIISLTRPLCELVAVYPRAACPQGWAELSSPLRLAPLSLRPNGTVSLLRRPRVVPLGESDTLDGCTAKACMY